MEIYELSISDIDLLYFKLQNAVQNQRRVRFALDGGLKIKVGEGMWTPPLGEPEEKQQ